MEHLAERVCTQGMPSVEESFQNFFGGRRMETEADNTSLPHSPAWVFLPAHRMMEGMGWENLG